MVLALMLASHALLVLMPAPYALLALILPLLFSLKCSVLIVLSECAEQ